MLLSGSKPREQFATFQVWFLLNHSKLGNHNTQVCAIGLNMMAGWLAGMHICHTIQMWHNLCWMHAARRWMPTCACTPYVLYNEHSITSEYFSTTRSESTFWKFSLQRALFKYFVCHFQIFKGSDFKKKQLKHDKGNHWKPISLAHLISHCES